MSLTHSHFRADSDMNNHKYLYGWRARPCSVIAVSAVSAVIAVVTSEMCPAGISAHLTQCTQSSSPNNVATREKQLTDGKPERRSNSITQY